MIAIKNEVGGLLFREKERTIRLSLNEIDCCKEKFLKSSDKNCNVLLINTNGQLNKLSKGILVNNDDCLLRFCSINIKILNHQEEIYWRESNVYLNYELISLQEK